MTEIAKADEERRLKEEARLADIAKEEKLRSDEAARLAQEARLLEETRMATLPNPAENVVTQPDVPDATLEPDIYQPLRFTPQKQQPSWVRKTEWWE